MLRSWQRAKFSMRPKIASCVFLSFSAAFFAGTSTPEGGYRLTRSATIESANSSTSPTLNQSPIMAESRERIDAIMAYARAPDHAGGTRSEEHTSELQSRRDLVCRLLLEK